MAKCAASLFDAIPADVWHAAFAGGAGYLPDGTSAKLPCGHACLGMIRAECTDPETFAVRVACILKYYHHLTFDVAMAFAAVMDVAAGRAHEFMETSLDFLPPFARPTSGAWAVPECDPRDFGVFLCREYLPVAAQFAEERWSVSFRRLSLNSKAVAIHGSRQREVKEAAKETAKEVSAAQLRASVRKRLISEIDEMCWGDDVDEAGLRDALAAYNARMRGIPREGKDGTELRDVLASLPCTYSSQSRRSEYISYTPEASLMLRLERLESGQVAAVNLAGDVLLQSEAHVLLTQLHDQLHDLHPITFVGSEGEELPLTLNGQRSLGELA
jgi:hypothetical protein